ncbi:nlpC/P60 family protein [Mycobacterium xenopi 3993]|nr:nlpC/P60 family protein [Mycobacterium xenopi 3993]
MRNFGVGLDGRRWGTCGIKRSAVGVIAGFVALSGALSANVLADPSDDALAKLNELSRQAEQTTEAMHSAQLDLNEKLAAQRAAEKKHADAQADLEAAKARLATFQASVNKFAAAMYMGGRTDGMEAILTAESPQQLISKLAVQRVISTEMATQMASYRAAGEAAAKAEQASAKSAADAKTAAEQAAAVRASLQSKQSRLQLQIAVVKSQYQSLTRGSAPRWPIPGRPAADGIGRRHRTAGIGTGWFAGRRGSRSRRARRVTAGRFRRGRGGDRGAGGPHPGRPALRVGWRRAGGFDCSGLVMWAFQQAGIPLPHSSQALAHGGQPVALSDLQPGDVLTFYSDASHAGIYIGDGLMVHSSTYGQPVRVVPMTSSGPIYNARRY